MALFKRKKTEEIKEEKTQKIEASVKSTPKKTVIKKAASDKDKKNAPKNYAARTLIHPLMSEKTSILSSLNQYAFVVAPRANKISIKKSIQEAYGITPLKVRIINVLGKSIRSGRNRVVKRKNWKKAIVTLPADKNIDIYER